MFQYAFGRYLSIKNNTGLKLDISTYNWYKTQRYLLDNFNINAENANAHEINQLKGNRLLKKIGLGKKSYILEKSMAFDKSFMDTKDNSYLEGYWFSHHYFKDISDILRKEFTLNQPLSKSNEEMCQKIKETENSVSVHFRRGDYITNPETNRIHGTCTLDYYNKAIAYISKNTKCGVNLYIFTDDTKWVKENFHSVFPYTIININSVDTGYNDMYLMSQCQHHITANSSFSWWGAWLDNNPEHIVTTPKKWYNVNYDTSTSFPERWIKL